MKRSLKTFDTKYLFELSIKGQQSQDFLIDMQACFWQYLKHIEVHFHLHLFSISILHSSHHRSHRGYLTCDTHPHIQKYLCMFRLARCWYQRQTHGVGSARNFHNVLVAIGHLENVRFQIKIYIESLIYSYNLICVYIL